MNRVAIDAMPAATGSPGASRQARLLLLGTGTVGSAFVERWRQLEKNGLTLPRFHALANSRTAAACGAQPAEALRVANQVPRATPGRSLDGSSRGGSNLNESNLSKSSLSGSSLSESSLSESSPCGSGHGRDAFLHHPIAAMAAPTGAVSLAEGLASPRPGDIVIDATASDLVASRHAHWLARGIHVVTANKLGNGADLPRAQAIVRAQREGGAQYGDSATVGAGLPLLRSIRALVAGGDRIHAVEGVLSGSLGWLFNHYDGERPFSDLVREARDAGYTEPDPRIDLSGEDVRRKLLILARAANLPLDAGDIRVDSLVPEALARADAGAVDGLLPALDAPLGMRYRQAHREGARLRFVGRFEADAKGRVVADVGLRALPADHALCGGSGTDNRVAISSDRYRAQPLVVQGPGAGAEITAAALLDDVIGIAQLQ